MSSLQKFHRRTNPGVKVSPFTTIGSGNDTIGYYLGGTTTNKLVVSPISTEITAVWGSFGTARGTSNASNGLTNTNTLYAFGSDTTSGHPAAYYCKTLTTGGYNTWYLPAINEMTSLISNKSAMPFATSNSFGGGYYWSSTETWTTVAWANNDVWVINGNTASSFGHIGGYANKTNVYKVRAARIS